MVYDIDVHQSNLEQFINLKFLDEILFEKCGFLHLFNNKCIIVFLFNEKTTTISKRRRFYKRVLQ